MKRFLVTTALALVMVSPAYLAHGEVREMTAIERLQLGEVLASDLIGMRIYATENDVEAQPYEAGAEQDWDDIGEVNDVILTTDGSVRAVVLGIGGFLGIGERDIAIEMSSLTFVREADDRDDFFIVVNANREALENTPAFESQADDRSGDMEAPPKDQVSEVEKTDMQPTGDMGPTLVRPTVVREGYRDAEPQDITADMLEGIRVYGANDEDVGEIDRLVITTDGQVKYAVVDVGGFLGIGEHSIAVTMDELQIMREDDGDGIRVFIDSTQSELEKKPEYTG